MRICWVALIGRPNTGKSTLLNKIIKYDLSIISPLAQTTRDQINGIYTDDEYQIIFLDTPGIHKPLSLLGEELNKKAFASIKDADVVLFLSPANENISSGDKNIIEKIANVKNKIAIVTKKDLIKEPTLILEKQKELQSFGFESIFYTSSLDEKSIDTLLDEIKKYAREDVQYYDADDITDKTELFLSREIIRASAIKFLKDEIPHSIAIEINEYHIDENSHKREIEATIYCKKASQKRIIIGKNASMIKKIGTLARKEIMNKFNFPVRLNLYVKISQDWVNNKKSIKTLGY